MRFLELDASKSNRGQRKRQQQMKRCYKTFKRWLRIFGKDFRRRLYRVPFILEVIGIIVVVAYTSQTYKANRLTKESMVLTQRAFVTVANVTTTHEISKEDQTRFEGTTMIPQVAIAIAHKNSGTTPARNARIKVTICLHHGDTLPSDFSFPENGVFGSPYLIPPNGDPVVTYTRIDAANLDKVRDLSAGDRLFVYGSIEYMDVFGQSHATEYCFAYEGEQINVQTRSLYTQWNYCDRHNCDDEGCPDKWGDNPADCPTAPAPPLICPTPVAPTGNSLRDLMNGASTNPPAN